MAMMGIVGMMMKTEKMKAGMTKAKKTKAKKTKVKMTKMGMKKMIQMMMGLKTMVIKTMTRTVEKTMEMLETMMNKMDRTIIAETMMTSLGMIKETMGMDQAHKGVKNPYLFYKLQ